MTTWLWIVFQPINSQTNSIPISFIIFLSSPWTFRETTQAGPVCVLRVAIAQTHAYVCVEI